ncbi:hypothetical protein [Frankia sp. EI5c]|nr:hypothetical protein [Frankia sp. EI5c]
MSITMAYHAQTHERRGLFAPGGRRRVRGEHRRLRGGHPEARR